MSTRLIDMRMNDGRRHFASLPETYDVEQPEWHRLRAHVGLLSGAHESGFITDDVTEAWIDFEFHGQAFSLNNQAGEWWFFVEDPDCPARILTEVLDHFERLLSPWSAMPRGLGPLAQGCLRVVVIGEQGKIAFADFNDVAAAKSYADDLASEGDRVGEVVKVYDSQLEPIFDGRHYVDAELSRFELVWWKLTGKPGEDLHRELTALYGEAHRHYHTLAHVRSCLEELRTLELDTADRENIELAIWFHDAVYQPLANDNEEKSAALFRAKAAGTDSPRIDQIAAMIEASRTHEIFDGRDDRATRCFLDIDLSILGAGPEDFDLYNRAIRQEFAAIPERDYDRARKAFLKELLDREHIFLTPELRVKYEQDARARISSLLSR